MHFSEQFLEMIPGFHLSDFLAALDHFFGMAPHNLATQLPPTFESA